MPRPHTAILALLLLAGCIREPTTFDTGDPVDLAPWPEHERAILEAALPTPIRGQALLRGRVAVGLDGGVAELDPIDKAVGTVIQASYNNDIVFGARMDQGHLQVVTLNDLDVRVVDIEAGGFLAPIFVGDRPRSASFLTDGRLVVLVQWPERCEVFFVHDDVKHDLPACSEALSMRPVEDRGVLVALGSTGVFHVTVDGSSIVHDQGNLVDWNPVAGHAVIATAGKPGIEAVDLDGQIVWTRTTATPVRALAQLGATDELVWAVQLGDGAEVVWGEGADVEIARMVHDEPVVHLASDETGTRIGVARLRDYGNYQLFD